MKQTGKGLCNSVVTELNCCNKERLECKQEREHPILKLGNKNLVRKFRKFALCNLINRFLFSYTSVACASHTLCCSRSHEPHMYNNKEMVFNIVGY